MTDDAMAMLRESQAVVNDCASATRTLGNSSEAEYLETLSARISAHLAAPAPDQWVAENLAMMLRRLIYQINKLDGDSSLKVLSGKAVDLLILYGLQGNPLREIQPLPKEET